MQAKLIIIGAGVFQIGLINKARDLGYETHVFAWTEGAVGREQADFFYPISIVEKKQILKIARKIKPAGVISIASDLAVTTVNYLASELGTVGNSLHSSLVSTNKFEMRRAFTLKGIPCPKFRLVDKDFDPDQIAMSYPLIVKPVDRSGSRGVAKVTNAEELNAAIQIAQAVSFRQQVIVEELIKGQEYSMEMISYRGEHQFLAITEKFTTDAPHFVEKMHLQPGRIQEHTLKKAIEIVKIALDALDIKYGASHAEFRVTKDEDIMIIEIGARMGGDYIGSDLVALSTGNDYLKMAIDIATANQPSVRLQPLLSAAALVKFIFEEKDWHLFENLKKYHPESLYSYANMRPINNHEVTNSSERYGGFILRCNSHTECLDLVGER